MIFYMKPTVIVLMGVAGSGKTTVGRRLARNIGWEYLDADDFHPTENIARMRSGQPLSDADRQGWLENLAQVIADHVQRQAPLVLACSALKAAYRRRLQGDQPEVQFAYLHGDHQLLLERLLGRHRHFMPPQLLDSQLRDLEPPPPSQALWLDIAASPTALVRQLRQHFQL
jgi:gluconokinase